MVSVRQMIRDCSIYKCSRAASFKIESYEDLHLYHGYNHTYGLFRRAFLVGFYESQNKYEQRFLRKKSISEFCDVMNLPLDDVLKSLNPAKI